MNALFVVELRAVDCNFFFPSFSFLYLYGRQKHAVAGASVFVVLYVVGESPKFKKRRKKGKAKTQK